MRAGRIGSTIYNVFQYFFDKDTEVNNANIDVKDINKMIINF